MTIRKFNYKPQFYAPDEEKKGSSSGYNSDEFAQRLHRNWNSKRTAHNKNKSNTRRLVWCAALAGMLVFLCYKIKNIMCTF